KELIQPQTDPEPAPKKVAHIGIAVHKIDDVLPFYLDSLRLSIDKIETIESQKVKVAFLPIGETYIELLEPTDKSSTIHHFLEKNGEGVHHIALEVANIEKRIQQMKHIGIQMIDETPTIGAEQSKIA